MFNHQQSWSETTHSKGVMATKRDSILNFFLVSEMAAFRVAMTALSFHDCCAEPCRLFRKGDHGSGNGLVQDCLDNQRGTCFYLTLCSDIIDVVNKIYIWKVWVYLADRLPSPCPPEFWKVCCGNFATLHINTVIACNHHTAVAKTQEKKLSGYGKAETPWLGLNRNAHWNFGVREKVTPPPIVNYCSGKVHFSRQMANVFSWW